MYLFKKIKKIKKNNFCNVSADSPRPHCPRGASYHRMLTAQVLLVDLGKC